MSIEKPIYGIDVSVFQGDSVNWKQVREQGFRFMIARASLGPVYSDPTYHKNVAEAAEAGLITGAYHALTNKPIKAQVDNFLSATRNGDHPFQNSLVAVDVEKTSYGSPSFGDAREFILGLRRRGVDQPILLYSGGYWRNPKGPDGLGNPSVKNLVEKHGVRLWDAHYYGGFEKGHARELYDRYVPRSAFMQAAFGGERARIVQFTSTAAVDGQFVDVDAFAGPMEDLKRLAGIRPDGHHDQEHEPGDHEPGDHEPGDHKPGDHKPGDHEPRPEHDRERELHEMVEKAIDLGTRLVGTPYGNGFVAGTWPSGPSLYARCNPKVHTLRFIGNHAVICSGLINVLRAHVADLPACGRAQGDSFPGGTAAIGRHFAHAKGTRPYPPIKNSPRGWLCFSPFLGNDLEKQGHVGIALGDGRLLEARVPAVSKNRTEMETSNTIVRFGGKPFTRIIPPEIWLRR